jgi:hypothetical protein
MTPDDARRLALRLPEAVEHDHGRPSFRIADKIFATLRDERTMNMMVDEPGIRTAVAGHPQWCTERYWGRRLAAVAVDLEYAPTEALAELLTDAWQRKHQHGFPADHQVPAPSQPLRERSSLPPRRSCSALTTGISSQARSSPLSLDPPSVGGSRSGRRFK